MTRPDHGTMMWEEVAAIGDTLHDLRDDEWDVPSLCDGWAVRDVVGHMCFGHTTPMAQIAAGMVRYRFDVAKGSFALSRDYAQRRTPAELLEVWDRDMVGAHKRIGISRTIRSSEGFLDHLIHHSDIRRPLGRPVEVPDDRLLAALELVPKVHTPFFSTRKVVDGLRLTATDVDWTCGDGPRVEGAGEALVLAAAGRTVVLDELEGDGVAVLTDRIER
jgi:uncharacterized protein (TIGR03083 family)